MKIFRKLILFFLIIGLLPVSLPASANALQPVQLYIGNAPVAANPSAVLAGEYTLVPLRIVAENLNCQVDWSEEDQRITITQGAITMTMQIGHSEVQFSDGIVHTLPTPPILFQDSTMVPVRFVSETLGKSVQWHAPTQSVFIDADVLYQQVCAEYDSIPLENIPASGLDNARTLYQDGMLYEAAALLEALSYDELSDGQRAEAAALLTEVQNAILSYEDSFNVKAVVYVANVEDTVNFRTLPSVSSNVICTIPFSHAVGWISDQHDGFTRVEYNGMYGYIKSEYLAEEKPIRYPVRNEEDAKWYAQQWVNNNWGTGYTIGAINGPYYAEDYYYYTAVIRAPKPSGIGSSGVATLCVYCSGYCELKDW